MTEVGWTVGDTEPPLSGSVKDGDQVAVITGATLQVRLRRPDRTILVKTATVVSGPDGTWRTTAWAAGDLNQAGDWDVDVAVTFSGATGPQTFPGDSFPVRPKIV